jgi:hypothetical protein
MINLVIERVTTADMDDGQPLPPFMDNSAIWHVVDRFPDQKRTLWRRISIQTNTTQPCTTATWSRGDFLGGRSNKLCPKYSRQQQTNLKQRRKNRCKQ